MTEIRLTDGDKKRIKIDIQLTLFFGTALILLLIILVGLIPLIAFVFGKTPADGFVKRGLFFLSFVLLLHITITWKNLFKFVDLRTGRKINFQTNDFELDKTKTGLVLVTRSPIKLKLDLYDQLEQFISLKSPLTIEVTKLSKTLLFVSHDKDNLLDKVEKENA
jgi:hypothetical protein